MKHSWWLSMLGHLILLSIFAFVTFTDPRDTAFPTVVVSSQTTKPSVLTTERFRFEPPKVESQRETSVPKSVLLTSTLAFNTAVSPATFQDDLRQIPLKALDRNDFLHRTAPPRRADLQAIKRDAVHKTTHDFHGIKSTGSRLIFIIDSSKSMRSKFDEAKSELHRSLRSLNTNQSVAVYFYDQRLYLPINQSGSQSSFPAPVTPEWIETLIRWSAARPMDAGGSPQQALTEALKAEPDIIYLLSDGEFSRDVIDRTTQMNTTVDGFGDRRRRCVIHCISYSTTSDGGTLKQLAAQNGGSFWHQVFSVE